MDPSENEEDTPTTTNAPSEPASPRPAPIAGDDLIVPFIADDPAEAKAEE